MIYLDNAATTYPKPDKVYEALDFAQRNLSFNAGRGTYKQSQLSLKVLDDLRKEIASFINEDYLNVSLQSSATEALNLIINGLMIKDGSNIYLTPFEHNAIIRPLNNLKKNLNINIYVLPFDKETWEPDISKIENMFALANPDFVFCSQISNVTGLMVDYNAIFEISKRYGSTNILDSAQAFGIIPIKKSNVDFVVFAGHKSMYGPFGIGGFINLKDYKLKIVKSGGTGSDTLNPEMPESKHYRYESGSQNIPAAYGTLVGLRFIKETNVKDLEKELTSYLVSLLLNNNKVKVFVPKDISNVFGIVSFTVEGYTADEVGRILNDEFDICVRTGYHCAPLVHDFINSLKNGGTVRASLGLFNTKDDINALVDALGTF